MTTNITFRITATAPTSYQTTSLRHFNIGCKANGNGSYSGYIDFDTEEEAKAYLALRAQIYFETESELNEAIADIAHGCLTLDAVTARIEEIEPTYAVIYANESNIWDNDAHKFHFFRENTNIDETSYAMLTEKAEQILQSLKDEYPDAYIVDCTPFTEEN